MNDCEAGRLLIIVQAIGQSGLDPPWIQLIEYSFTLFH